MNIIPVDHLDDPRLTDYAQVRERQLAQAFSPHAVPGAGEPGDPQAPWGKFMAEGEVVFPLLVDSPYRTLSVLCTPTRLESIRPLLPRLPEGAPVYVLPQRDLDRLVGFHLHRGLMAVGARNPPTPLADILARARLVLVLEDLTNHDNVGAAFRNAAAFGAGGILMSPRCADPLYRKAIRVSVGHALRLPFATVPEWPEGLREVQRSGFRLVGLSPQAPAEDLRMFHVEPHKDRIACLVGSEGPGLSPACLAMVDARVRIEMAPGVDSLNVSVSAAIALEHLNWALNRGSAPTGPS